MASISNISVGANFAGNYAIKARHEMNASIMRLSSGNRTLAGGDAAGGDAVQTDGDAHRQAECDPDLCCRRHSPAVYRLCCIAPTLR